MRNLIVLHLLYLSIACGDEYLSEMYVDWSVLFLYIKHSKFQPFSVSLQSKI